MKKTKNKKIKSINRFKVFVLYCGLFVLSGCDLFGNEKKIRKIISIPTAHQGFAEAADEDQDTEEEDTQDDQNAIDNKGYKSSSENEDKDPEQADRIEPSIGGENESTNPSKLNKSVASTQNEQNKKSTGTENNRDQGKNTIEQNLQASDQSLQKSNQPARDATEQNITQGHISSDDQKSVTLKDVKVKIKELEKILKPFKPLKKQDQQKMDKISEDYNYLRIIVKDKKIDKADQIKFIKALMIKIDNMITNK